MIPYTPMSSTCLAIHWFISPPLGGIRTIGVTFGASEPESTIWRRSMHGLERVPQRGRAHRRMLHLEGDTVEVRGGQRRGGLVVHRAESDERGLALLQGPDDAVQSRDLSHGSLSPRSGILVLPAAVAASEAALHNLAS